MSLLEKPGSSLNKPLCAVRKGTAKKSCTAPSCTGFLFSNRLNLVDEVIILVDDNGQQQDSYIKLVHQEERNRDHEIGK